MSLVVVPNEWIVVLKACTKNNNNNGFLQNSKNRGKNPNVYQQ